ncbi:MAG TPA: MFS transporter [Acetobacteraceae bacterium]|jgi:MFS family permease|nr:MFS transporter [Acetobacteraceae bacterium]
MTAPSSHIAPWYAAYLILGLLTSGMLPFLLPLVIADISHQLGTVAYVTGAYNLGLLPAPLLGRLAERAHLHRPLFFGAFVVLALAFAAFPHVSSVGPWFVLALLIGLATGAAATVATLFIVDFTPRAEWGPRIGWLQSFNGAGQLVGLLLAGAFARGGFGICFTLAAGLALMAIVVGHFGLPQDGARRVRDQTLGHVALLPTLRAAQLGTGFGGLLHHSHHLQWAGLQVVRGALRGPFARVLIAWAAYNFGVAAFFTYYPLMMRRSYGVAPELTAVVYAMAAGIGVVLFLLASRLTARRGGRIVFQAGIAVRLLGFVLLGLPFLVTLPHVPVIALAGFVLVVLAWPVISVAGTTLAARLTPIGEGAAIGLLSAIGALATVLGTFAGGPLVRGLGYGVLPVMALVGLGLAEFIMFRHRRRHAVPSKG